MIPVEICVVDEDVLVGVERFEVEGTRPLGLVEMEEMSRRLLLAVMRKRDGLGMELERGEVR